MHAHHVLGFIELEPLAIGVVDLVYVIVALMCLLLVAAGWVLLYILHLAFGKISIFGAHPFNFLYGLMTAALKSVFTQLEQRLVATGHFFWALAQMIWRPLFVILQLMQWVAGQVIGVQQNSNQGLAQVRAQEQQDVAALRAKEESDHLAETTFANQVFAASEQHANNLFNQLTNTLNTDIASVRGKEAADIATVNRTISSVNTQLRTLAANDLTTAENHANQLYNQAIAALNADVTSLRATDASDLTQAKNFATGLVNGLGVSALRTTLTALQAQTNRIQTETDDCLTPLCDTVTPQAPRLGRLGNLLGQLEALGIEALLVALAAECLTDPGAVATDVNTVVQDIGNPLMTGFRDLIGA